MSDDEILVFGAVSEQALSHEETGLTSKRLSEGRTSTSTISRSDIATLDHELWTGSMSTLCTTMSRKDGHPG